MIWWSVSPTWRQRRWHCLITKIRDECLRPCEIWPAVENCQIDTYFSSKFACKGHDGSSTSRNLGHIRAIPKRNIRLSPSLEPFLHLPHQKKRKEAKEKSTKKNDIRFELRTIRLCSAMFGWFRQSRMCTEWAHIGSRVDSWGHTDTLEAPHWIARSLLGDLGETGMRCFPTWIQWMEVPQKCFRFHF